MTNHSALYMHAVANLGRKFRNEVVVYKSFPNIRRVGADSQSIIYEKF